MIPWIQVYSNLLRHPKTTNLADELGLSCNHASPNAVAAGMLVSLWLWAAQNATDGDLGKCSDRAIAEAAEYRKKPAALVTALIKTGWLDEDRKLHDWDEYAVLLYDIEARNKENTRNRVQRYRERKKLAAATPETQEKTIACNIGCNVTHNECNAPTLPNHTLPNITVPRSNTDGEKTESLPGPAESAPLLEGKAFTSFWEAYPWKMNREEAWEAWKTLNPDFNTVIKIMAGLEAWKKSERWTEQNGRFIPGAAKFLRERDAYWGNPPAPAAAKSQQGYVHGADRLLMMLERGDFDD